jgi:hypothetical protein
VNITPEAVSIIVITAWERCSIEEHLGSHSGLTIPTYPAWKPTDHKREKFRKEDTDPGKNDRAEKPAHVKGGMNLWLTTCKREQPTGSDTLLMAERRSEYGNLFTREVLVLRFCP